MTKAHRFLGLCAFCALNKCQSIHDKHICSIYVLYLDIFKFIPNHRVSDSKIIQQTVYIKYRLVSVHIAYAVKLVLIW